jgi:hypothetical protein
MDAAPQFDQVWGHLCDEEGNTITRMGRVRVGLWTCFVFQTRDKVSLTSYLTPADTKGVRCTTKNRTKHGHNHNPVCQPWSRKICEVEPSA